MPPSLTARAWGRGPLVVAGIALACVLAALASLVFGAATNEELVAFGLTAGFLLLALLALAVLAALLVRDRFPRTTLERLDVLELRVGVVENRLSAARGEGTVPAPVPAREVPAPARVPAEVGTEASERPAAAAEAPAPRFAPALEPPPAPPPTPVAGDGGARPAASLELLLGGRALAVAGALVLVVAVALLVKYGWDRGWFRPSPAQRIAIGVGIGMALLALGETARRASRYRALAEVLTAGGVGALYVSAWAAHGLYGLVPAAAAFLLLAAAAAVGVAVATATRGRVVASLATAGGLLVPWLVELGPRPPTSLYGYLLLLLLAVLAVSATRRWPELGVIALVGTGALVAAAMEWRWPDPAGLFLDAGFLLAAMAAFFGITLASAWRRREAPGMVELAVLACASLAGWGGGLVRLDPQGTAVGGAWTVTVLLLELVAAHVLLVRLGAETQGRRLFLGLALVLLTALPPVLWDGAGVAVAWAVEAAVLLLAVRVAAGGHGAALVAVMAAAAAASSASEAMAATAPEPWQGALRLGAAALLAGLLVVVERRCAGSRPVVPTLAVAAGPAAATAVLAWALPAIEGWAAEVASPRVAGSLLSLLSGLAFGALGAVLVAAWRWRPLPLTFATGALLVVACLLTEVGGGIPDRWRGAAAAAPVAVAAAAIAALAVRVRTRDRDLERWAVAVGSGVVAASAALRLVRGWPGTDVLAGGLLPAALGLAAAGLLLAAARVGMGWTASAFGRVAEVAGWLVALAAGSRLLASAIALAGAAPGPDDRRLAGVALSVLWGAAGLAGVLAGLLGRAPHRRHLGLALLGLTLAKVFLSDLAAAPTVLRIVAFLVTGLALLAGAFLYARFRERLEAGA